MNIVLAALIDIAILLTALQWIPQVIETIQRPRNTDSVSFGTLYLSLLATTVWGTIDLLYRLPWYIPAISYISILPLLLLIGIKIGYKFADYEKKKQ